MGSAEFSPIAFRRCAPFTARNQLLAIPIPVPYNGSWNGAEKTMATTVWGSTTKPMSARSLASMVESETDLSGTLYIGYPVLGTPDGAFPFDAVLLSPQHGAVLFDIVEGKALGDYGSRQDNMFSKLQSKLIQYQPLVKRRKLLPTLTTVTFAPAASTEEVSNGEHPLFTSSKIIDFVKEIEWEGEDTYPAMASAIQALSTIRKGKRKKESKRPDTRGDKLQRLNDSIANLDAHQSAAVIETVDGVQRIRGLAGSGKTIVLALKVAYLHAQHPEWQIAITFNTRSLREQFTRLVNNFVYEQTNEEPDWDKIDIIHSWGSPNTPAGMYYSFTKENNTVYYDFRAAQDKFGADREFDGACKSALDGAPSPKQIYDAILIDEAQDLPPSFLQLCYRSLKPPKRLVYAYDELQSLNNATLPPPEELFGTDKRGRPYVQFAEVAPGQPRQDIILRVCYRNSRPILATAHALGFGIYREPDGLIATFDQAHLWKDVGYVVRNGELRDDQYVSLARTPKTSPLFLESHSNIDDLIAFRRFETEEEQTSWLVDAIQSNIENDDLSADDIIVINPDPMTTRRAVSSARAALFERNINNSLAGVSGSPDIFFENDVVTFTGIFRAKGNEAGMVYIVNAHDCYSAYLPAKLTRIRSQLFTAITRSKAWVRVLGVGHKMDQLISEYERVKENDFCLNFTYPNEQRRKEMRTINRDLTRTEQENLSKRVADLTDVVSALDQGDVKLEDLPASLRRRLAALLRV
ncbi:ATP-binding domain-containing protein [Methylobacterium sp. OT2]|uniref:DEAD/DEAH box helicase n=1 Tax=Methylobacterium sp. OT2 TaxID=2813779 RepID=UPI00197C2DC1|nr:ATP-binding domain-containing protein [Methylobacterium sp. OT2]MBN4092707.1 DEAD/DEAH box helicase [Methylobacterium sp. OT2]